MPVLGGWAAMMGPTLKSTSFSPMTHLEGSGEGGKAALLLLTCPSLSMVGRGWGGRGAQGFRRSLLGRKRAQELYHLKSVLHSLEGGWEGDQAGSRGAALTVQADFLADVSWPD